MTNYSVPNSSRRPSTLSLLALAGLLAALANPGLLPADEAGAKKYLDQAKKQVADKDQASVIQTTLQLAEAELAGVDAAKKEPIVQEIAAIRAQLAGAEMEAFKQNALRELERDFETAQKLLGVRNAGIVKMLDDLDKKLNDPKVQTALGPAKLGEYRTKLATFQTVNRTKLGEAAVDEMKRQVEFIEGTFAETMKELKEGSPLGKQNTAASFERGYQSFVELAKEAPKDNPTAGELTAKMQAMQKQVAAAYGMSEAAEVHDRLKRDWDSYASGWQGWEEETTAPKFADLVSNRSQANSRLGAPKTAELYNQASRWLERVAENEQAKPYANMPPVKDLIDTVTKLRNDSLTKLDGYAEAIVGEAEKATLNLDSRNRLESLVDDDLRLSLPGSPRLSALQKRGHDAVARFDATAKAGADAMGDARKQLTADAATRWPDLVKSVPTTDKFDPANPAASKGKAIRLQNVGNRSGFLDDGTYDFAMEIDGKPLVGKYSQEVKQAIADVTAKTGSGLPFETPYDIVAVYEGEQAVMQRRVDFEAQTDDGKFKVRGEEKKPVDVPILKIVGLYCGPVAVLGPVAGSNNAADVAMAIDGGGWGGFFYRLIDLALMLLAGMCVLIKAQFAPLANVPQLGVARENLTDRNQMIIGFLFLALAIYRIIIGYVIYGLIGNVALLGAGLFLTLGFFQSQSWFKPQWADQVRKFAVPIGITCAVIGLVRLFMGGALLAV